MRKWIIILSLLIAVVVGFNIAPVIQANAGRDLSPYCMGTAPVKKIPIEAREGAFVPGAIEVRKGDCIELRIRATGGVAHNAVIEGTGITTEGAPLVNSHGRHMGRAVAREHPACPACGELKEGWFANREQVLLKFQANKAGTYNIRCTAKMMSANITVLP